MSLNRILEGLVLGEKQDAGIMSVIPLLDPNGDATTEHADFEDIKFLNTQNYGSLAFSNNSDKEFILPAGYTIITKQKAQDHGIPTSTVLAASGTTSVKTACCVEQNQPGMIDGTNVDNFNFLPLYVRKEQFLSYGRSGMNNYVKNSFDFARLWPTISQFQKKLVKESGAHLVYFFTKFIDQLNAFDAEFESREGQRGAIILINNKIVGIEVAPTTAYWKKIWHKLIRDCYASEVIRLTTEKLVKSFEDSQTETLDLSNCSSIEDIENAMSDHRDIYQKNISDQLSELLDGPVDIATEKLFSSNTFSHNLVKMKKEKVFGEYYTDKNGKIVYATVLL